MLKRLVKWSRIILPFIYKLVFDKLYIKDIAPRYSYMGTFADYNQTKEVITWVVLCLFLLGISFLREDKLKSFLRISLYFSIIPSLSLFALKNENSVAFILIFFYWIIMYISIYVVQTWKKPKRSIIEERYLPDGDKLFIWIIFGFSVISTLVMWLKYGGARLFINFSDVYEYRNSGVSMKSYEQYFIYWNTQLILPLCMYIFFISRKYVRFVISIIMMLFSYAIFGNKSMFFYVFCVIGVVILSKIRIEALTDIMIGTFLLFYQTLCLLIPKGFLLALDHRLLVIPSEAHYYYYDFFRTNELLYLRQSILRFFFKAPYDRPVSLIIGGSQKYYPSVTINDINNMNNGWFSDAYQNFGVIGAVIYPLLIVFTLYMLFRAMQNYDQGFQFIVLISSVIFLMSSSYFSWLLTGGIILLFLGLRHIRRTRYVERALRIRFLSEGSRSN